MAVPTESIEKKTERSGLSLARPRAVDESYKWIVAGVVIIGAVMTILDQTVVNVALPTLEKEFNATLSDIQWVVTAYSLALAGVIPLSAWLSDRFGNKGVLFASELLFTIGSALCGLAWSHNSLVAFRVLQGLGGGLIVPVGTAILMLSSRPDERGRLFAAMGVPLLLGPAFGPAVGGWLIQAFSWRLIFYINVPIGVIACTLTALLLREVKVRNANSSFDFGGLALVSPAVIGMVYGLSQPNTYGWWSGQTLIPLLGGAALLVVFCFYELQQRQPLIDVRVFRDAAFSAAMILVTLLGFGLFAVFTLLPLFLQQVQGYGALDAGVIVGAQGVGAALVIPLAGTLTDRIGAAKVVPVGLTVITVSSLWMTNIAPDTSRAEMIWMLGLRGVGMALTMIPPMASAYVTLLPQQIPMATTISNVIQRVSSGFGVAVMATILSNRIAANLPAMHFRASGGIHTSAVVKSFILAQIAKGYDQTIWITVGIMLIGFPTALLLKRALRPAAVRAYALEQLKSGLVLGLTAQYVRDGRLAGQTLPTYVAGAYTLLAVSGAKRLRTARQLLMQGTSASGLVPQERLSAMRQVSIVLLALGAAVGFIVALVHGSQAPSVPPLPLH